jgi:hypothetical protein
MKIQNFLRRVGWLETGIYVLPSVCRGKTFEITQGEVLLRASIGIWIINLNNLNYLNMGNLLYIVAVVLVIIWAIGFFGYAAGGIIHVLLVIALVLFLLKVIRREA